MSVNENDEKGEWKHFKLEVQETLNETFFYRNSVKS